MAEAYILAGARTPIGKFLGAFQQVSAPELGALAIREALQRSGVAAVDVEDVIMGNILSAGLGQAPARQAALKAGLPSSVSALTINKMCGSGLQAVMLADQAIRAGDAQVVVAGGMENMTRAPHLLQNSREGYRMGDVTVKDSMILDGLWCAFEDCHMGAHADYIGQKYGVSRGMQDEFALESQLRAAKAGKEGEFKAEIVSVTVRSKREEIVVSADEGPRPETTMAGLAKLKPVFGAEGAVTAGNASLLSDGAAAVVVASGDVAKRTKSPWRARIVASATSGVDPKDIFIAPVAAVQKVVKKAGLSLKDIDLFEINEAFASQVVACAQELKLDMSRVNVNGGAIAIGHPIGASGARVLVTLLAALERRNLKRGLASLCLGGGNAVAMIVEREQT